MAGAPVGSPLPQASQNCDAEWQGARATALPEGFRPRGEQIPKPPRQACMEREKASKKGLEEWEEVERGDPEREGLERGKCLEAWLGRRGWWRCRVRR